VVVALAQAALGATRGGQTGDPPLFDFYRQQMARRRHDELTRELCGVTEVQRIAKLAAEFETTVDQIQDWLDDSDELEMVRIYEAELERLKAIG
jgi:hypothetical protein